MAVKSEVVSGHVAPQQFPKLMQTERGLVVLMKERGIGTVVVENGGWSVGTMHDYWAMDEFSDLVGTVTLTNEGR